MNDAGRTIVAPEAEAGGTASAPRVRGRLFRKYVALFAAVVCIALLANGAFEIWFSYRDHEASLIRIQREQAASAAAKIEQFIAEIRNQIGWTTELPWSSATLDQRRFDALRLLRQVPAITELSQLDASGKEQLRVSRLEMDVIGAGTDYSHDPRFVEAMAHKVYYGPVYFRRESEPYMTLALAGARKDAGVSVAEVNLKFIWDVVSQIKVGAHGLAYVVDADGRLIAHPDISLVLRKTNLSRLAQVAAALAAIRGGEPREVQVAEDLSGQQVLTASAPVAPLKWLVFVELPLSEANAPLFASIERAGLMLVACLGLAVLAGLFLARRMVGPIRAMRDGAARIGGGDLSQRLAIRTGDEIEALADQFNDMAARLQDSYAGLERKVEERTRELRESLDQQTATSEVLRVISASPGDLGPIFDTIIDNATRLCEAKLGSLCLRDGDGYQVAALLGAPEAYAEVIRREAPRPGPGTVLARLAETHETTHIADMAAAPAYRNGDPLVVAAVELFGVRSILGVPMLAEGKLVGGICIYRQEVRPFTDKQIALVENFAAQAVIAIENARLLSELREALDRQTATAEVLGVISSSPGVLKPVFDTMIENAVRLCSATAGRLFLRERGSIRVEARYGPGLGPAADVGDTLSPPSTSGLGRALSTCATVHIPDIAADPGPLAGPRSIGLREGVRTLCVVPILREGELIGLIALYRTEVRPFTAKQIELVENFAKQAVIAIENARLLSELRESLDRQTAMAEVLGVISASPGELQPVFDTILENATRLCEADLGHVFQVEGDAMRPAAVRGADPQFETFLRGLGPIHPEPDSPVGRAIRQREPILIADLASDAPRTPIINALLERGARTSLVVPMIKDAEVTGTIVIYRPEARPFAQKHIDLVANFAKQAVIAVENARLLSELRARTRDLQESLEHQTATSDVLKIIGRSTFDLKTVLDTLASSAARLCESEMGFIFRRDGEVYRLGAATGLTPDFLEDARRYEQFLESHPLRPGRETLTGRVAMGGQAVQILDVTADPEYKLSESFSLGRIRTNLGVPLLREGTPIGIMILSRQVVKAFTDKQIELATTFADQAVIAIENARLLTELRESLDRQTATADILRVIASTPGDPTRALDTIAETAVRMFGASSVAIRRRVGDLLVSVSVAGPVASRIVQGVRDIRFDDPAPMARCVRENRQLAFEDFAASAEVGEAAILARELNVRSNVFTPLIHDGRAIGAMAVNRNEVRPFEPDELELMRGFADQAVIAIENARLLSELRESLERQTATAQVLQVINRSPGELQPVFDAVLDKALDLCQAAFGFVHTYDGDRFRAVAKRGLAGAVTEPFREWVADPGSALEQLVRGSRVVHILDVVDTEAYRSGVASRRRLVELTGARTALWVALRRDDALLGAFVIYRQEVRPFDDKQIALVENFAAQAVIAIENARLLSELRQRTAELAQSVDELRALGEVSQAVNSTLDLQTVLTTIVAKAVEISATDAGAIYAFEEGPQEFRLRATHGMDSEMIAAIERQHVSFGVAALGEAASRRRPVQIADLREEPHNPITEIILRAGYRALLVVPLLRPDRVVGALVVRRREPGAFSKRTLDLLETFAAQSVVAIENAHLFSEIEQKGRELAVASQHKSQFLANMSHELRTPLNAILGYTELILDEIYGTVPTRVRETLERVQTNGRHLLGLINDVLDLSKIEAGQLTLALADYSVKEMAQGVFVAVEPLAASKGLALTLDVPQGIPPARGDERRISQVLLNLVGNAIKFTDAGEVAITASAVGGAVTIAVRDTGPGIALADQAKIFEEFQQADNSSTREKGGTGLGLAISRRIVQMHGGRLWVDSAPGKGSTFSFTLPLTVARQTEHA